MSSDSQISYCRSGVEDEFKYIISAYGVVLALTSSTSDITDFLFQNIVGVSDINTLKKSNLMITSANPHKVIFWIGGNMVIIGRRYADIGENQTMAEFKKQTELLLNPLLRKYNYKNLNGNSMFDHIEVVVDLSDNMKQSNVGADNRKLHVLKSVGDEYRIFIGGIDSEKLLGEHVIDVVEMARYFITSKVFTKKEVEVFTRGISLEIRNLVNNQYTFEETLGMLRERDTRNMLKLLK